MLLQIPILAAGTARRDNIAPEACSDDRDCEEESSVRHPLLPAILIFRVLWRLRGKASAPIRRSTRKRVGKNPVESQAVNCTSLLSAFFSYFQTREYRFECACHRTPL